MMIIIKRVPYCDHINNPIYLRLGNYIFLNILREILIQAHNNDNMNSSAFMII